MLRTGRAKRVQVKVLRRAEPDTPHYSGVWSVLLGFQSKFRVSA
jgi:hypothetical protein